MNKRIKQWLIKHFLPAWAKETMLKECEKLRCENIALKAKIKEQDIYIDGLVTGIKYQRRIVINTGEVIK